MKRIVPLVIVFVLGACDSSGLREKRMKKIMKQDLTKEITLLNPFNASVFPPEFPPPTFAWEDENTRNDQWYIQIETELSQTIVSAFTRKPYWKPDSLSWEQIKKESVDSPAYITLIGSHAKLKTREYSKLQARIHTSADSVGAPVFYRAVPLPFSYATSHLEEIKYMLGDISSAEKPKVLLENLPVCGNCHSFSPNGKHFGMDVDAFGDKGSYLIANVDKEVVMSPESFITWSDFQEKSTMALLSQVSPDGKHVVSTLDDNEIFESRDELLYSQLFFPIKGILTVYDTESRTYSSLPGASDTSYVQSNPSWSSDGNDLYFAREKAVQRKESGMTFGTGIYDLNKFQAMRDSFLSAKKFFKFDLMKLPFNEGEGGIPEPLPGASDNGKSNYFMKESPDGKWLVFCQAENYMLLQPDSKLYIMPSDLSQAPRLMKCNTSEMNSWHSWSPNSRWLVFSSKVRGEYTQLFLTHIDENGVDSPPVWLEYLNVDERAANIPEFVNVNYTDFNKIHDEFSHVADYNVRGTSKAQFGDYENAIIDFNKAIQIDRKNHMAYANRAKAQDELGNLSAALEDLTTAIELAPEEYDYYIHRSNTAIKTGDLQSAKKDASNAIKLEPQKASLYAHRAGISVMMSELEAAHRDFSTAIRLDPDYSLYYMHRAEVNDKLGKAQLALSDMDKAIQLNPTHVRYIGMKAEYAMSAGDTVLAKQSFLKAIDINPDWYKPYAQMGILLGEENDANKALEYFNKAIEVYDESSQKELAILYNNRGTIYGKANKYDLAVNDFTAAVRIFPTFADAYSNRAFAKLKLGRQKEAELDCTRALQLDPNSGKANMIMDMIKTAR